MSNRLKKYRRQLATADYRTYNGWLAVGRHVRRGQKAIRDKDGRHIFHVDQTSVNAMFISDGKGNSYDDYDSYNQYDPGY